MKFTYESPEVETTKREILEDGWYDFEVVNVYDKDRDGAALVTRTGTPWLKLICEESSGKATIFHAVFMAADNARRISALIYACRIEVEAGEEIELNAATFMGRVFRAKVETETGNDQVRRNKIIRAIRTEEAPDEPTEAQQEEEPEEEGEVPF